MAYSITVTSGNGLNYRTGAATSFPKKGAYPKGTKLECSEKVVQNDESWYKVASNGYWVCGRQGGDWYIKDNKPAPPNKTPDKKPNVENINENATSKGIDKVLTQMLLDSSNAAQEEFKGSTRLFGSPHQYIKQTDFRPSGKMDLGRMFLQNISSEAPIVNIIPGKPDYLPDISKEEQKAMNNLFKGAGKDEQSKSIISQILGNKDIRYFGFVSDYAHYMRYVNMLCRVGSIYIGIGDEIVPNSTTKYKD